MSVRSTEKDDFSDIFQETLLTWLRQSQLHTILALPPFHDRGAVRITPVSEPILKVKRGRRALNNLVTWPHLNLEAKANPFLAFVLRGSVDLSVGVTEQMATESGRTKHGLYHFRMPSQSLIVYPSNVPNPDGRKPHWEGEIKEQPDSTILWVDISPEGAMLHTCHTVKRVHIHGSNRFVLDSRLPLLTDWYIEELQSDAAAYAEHAVQKSIARPMLEMLLLRIARSLSLQDEHTINPQVLVRNNTDTGYPDETPCRTSLISPVKRACNFIHGRLNQALTVQKICHYTLVSPTQLNRLFRTQLGLSIMEYVNKQRLDMAKSLLTNTTLPVNAIARNVGLPNAVYFSRMFREKTGLTPLQYRNEHR
jgi:AraC-like DNA-binding protein